MKIRHFLPGAALMYCGVALAASSHPPGTSPAPAAAVKPCPQGSTKRGQAPVEQGMPCPGTQGDTTGPHAGPGPGMKQRAPAAETRSASSGAQQVFGWQLMTPDERTVYQQKMRASKTAEERAAIRAEHHKEMLDRAKQRGVTLPESPPPR